MEAQRPIAEARDQLTLILSFFARVDYRDSVVVEFVKGIMARCAANELYDCNF
jgi:hypothetical protein